MKKLLFGTTLFINFFSLSCFQANKSSFILLDSITINSFPSASAVEYYNQKLYVFGDDAAYLLVLDSSFNIVEKVFFEDSVESRLPLAYKHDIESTAIYNENGITYLYAIGSHSSGNRRKIFKFPLDSLHKFSEISYSIKEQALIKSLNIEGSSFVKNELLLANRANNSFRTNYLFFEKFVNHSDSSLQPRMIEILFPPSENTTGLSGLYYYEEKDILFFTASQEETIDPIEDGTIGKSFLGWVNSFSKNRNEIIKPEILIDLENADTRFSKSKIESVTVQHNEGNNIHLVLAADNDDGKSILYKVVVDVSR